MKLKNFKHREGYWFELTFENGETMEADLKELIGSHVDPDALDTARIDPDWGCLEFKGGMVDIEPKTLYRCAAISRQLAACSADGSRRQHPAEYASTLFRPTDIVSVFIAIRMLCNFSGLAPGNLEKPPGRRFFEVPDWRGWG